MNKKIWTKYLISCFFLIQSLFSCQKEEIMDMTRDDNLEAVISSEFNRLQLPGLAVAAVKDDSIVYMGTRGYANIHEKRAFTPQTRMLIASVSKTIAATAIMQLYEDGVISLDSDINNYLPFKVWNPNYPNDTITVVMLLTHTSSITDGGYISSAFYLYGYTDYPESLMSFVKNYLTTGGQYYREGNFSENRPGNYYEYSNVGAALLACLVEHVTGIDYNSYCKSNIFKPLGMNRTTWFFSETPKEEIAIPYNNKKEANPANPFFTYPTYPDGHLITTIEDLSLFMRAYIMDGTFNHCQLLKSESVNMILHNFLELGDDKQGLIFYETKIGKYRVWGHNGGDPGVSTEMYFDRESKAGYIMLNNRGDAYPEILGNALLQYANQ